MIVKNVLKKRLWCRCFLKGCKVDVIDIFWYLREVYDWSKEMVRKVILSYGMRKSFELKFVKNNKLELSEGKKIYIDYYCYWVCLI